MTLLEPAPLAAKRCAVSFASDLRRHGGRLAVATPDGLLLSYEDLADRVARAAAQLGAEPRLVLIAGANRLDALVWYLGALSAGHPVLLVPGDDDPTVDGFISAYDPDVIVGVRSGWELTERQAARSHELHPDLALLLCTSGSTGSSKLVRLSRANLQANAEAIVEYLGLGPDDVGVTSLPMAYCYGLSVIHSHLLAGAALIVTDRSVVDRCFWDDARRYGATNLAGVPFTFDLLERSGFESLDLTSLRFVTQAGGRLDPERVRALARQGRRDGWDLVVMYGQTEATARMAYLPPHLAEAHPSAIGRPIPGGSFELAPVEGHDDPDVGELVYRGANVMLGYAEEPADLALGPTVDALATGDLARRTADGLFEVVGRRTRFAKVFGLRLDLEHLERLLGQAGFAALCTSDDQRLFVAVEGERQVSAVVELLGGACRLPTSRLVVVPVAELPRRPNGKPDHAAVGALALAALAAPADVPTVPPSPGGPAPHPEIHPDVHRAFAHVLSGVPIAPSDTFVSLGGDSMSYVEVSIALEEALSELPPDWHVTPIRDLAAVRRPRRFVVRTETSVVLRAIAIVLVVGTHIKLFNLLGGAHLLLAIAGYNFTRFQVGSADRARSIARVAVPSMAWLAFASLLDERIHLTHVLLLNGWLGGDDAHGGYWYIESVVQILVPLGLLLAVPAVRGLERRHRFGFPLGVLTAGLLVRFHVIDLPVVEPHDIRPHDISWMFAIGWAAAQAGRARDRLLLSAVVLASVPGYFGEPQREIFVVVGMLLLLWLPSLPLIRPATRVIGAVAAGSLSTYLTHWQVFPPLDDRFGPVVALLGSLAVGTLGWSVVRALGRRVPRRRGAATRRNEALPRVTVTS
ncbi:MAG: AMP-binding protein [Acidimicrobiales bacterium]|nr:AMP-binding protein [Acidimicrobiales bacterium]